MWKLFNQLGGRLTRLFGEPTLGVEGFSKKQAQEAKDSWTKCPFAHLLPYEVYEEEYGLFINQNSMGFAIEMYPLVGSDETHQKEIHHLFEEILEEDASLQCLLFADHRIDPFLKKWLGQEPADNGLQEIAEKRRHFFQHQPKVATRLFRCVFSYSVPYKGELDLDLLQHLKMQKDKMSKILSALSYSFSWTPKHLLEFVGGWVNFSLSTEKKIREWNPYQTLASQLTTGGGLDVQENHLAWKTETPVTFKSFRVVDYPSSWSLAAMQHLIGDALRDNYRLDSPFYLHYGVHCPKQAKTERTFEMQSQLIEKQGKSGMLVRMIPALEEELKECRQVRQATAKGARFVWTQFSAGIWAKAEKANQAEQSLKSLFRLNHFTLADNYYLHLPQFLAALPFVWAEYVPDLKQLNVLKTTLTTECGNFVPCQGEWQGTAPHPGMLLLGRRGQLLNWNPFDNKKGNYNVVVAGRSGYGKSVFMQELIFNGLRTGAKVFVLEVGRSFAKLCQLLNGQAIEFSKQSSICLNPFTHISLTDEEERHTSFSFLKSIIGCMAAPTKGTTDAENSWIERAIRAAWEEKKTQATITDIAHWLERQSHEVAQNLGMILTPYTNQGIYARYFEGVNNVNFINPFVLIELEELKGKKDLQAVLMQIFIMTIANQTFLGNRQTPFFICIDEAWDLLENQQTGSFIETLARRLRKYRGSLVIGTQGIEDFFNKPGAQAAFANSDWKCFLAHKKDGVSKVIESGQYCMSEAQQHAMETVTKREGEYSEIMICDGDGGYAITRLILDPFSHLLYSTKAEEFSALKAYQEQGLSITEAIDMYLRAHAKT